MRIVVEAADEDGNRQVTVYDRGESPGIEKEAETVVGEDERVEMRVIADLSSTDDEGLPRDAIEVWARPVFQSYRVISDDDTGL